MVINGVRVLSFCWVLLGHAYVLPLIFPAYNIINLKDAILSGWLFPVVPGGFFAVDVFFYMSSFLAMYMMMTKSYKK